MSRIIPQNNKFAQRLLAQTLLLRPHEATNNLDNWPLDISEIVHP